MTVRHDSAETPTCVEHAAETDEPLPYPWPVPRRSRLFLTPVEWLAADGVWPRGPFVAEAPTAVAYAAHWAQALTTALEGVNRTALCAAVEIKRDTLYEILNGRTWADTVTLVKLEVELGASLWPERPLKP